MRHIAIISALLLTGCVAPAPTGAADDRPALAHQLAVLHMSPESWRARLVAYVDEYLSGAPDPAIYCESSNDPRRCIALTTKLTAELRDTLNDTIPAMEGVRLAYIEDLTTLYLDNYTTEEIKANIAFLESPVGRSIDAKQTAVMGQLATLQYKHLRGWSEALPARAKDFSGNYMSAFKDLFGAATTPVPSP